MNEPFPGSPDYFMDETERLRAQLAEREKEIAKLRSALDRNAWLVAAAKAQKHVPEKHDATIARQSAALAGAREELKFIGDLQLTDVNGGTQNAISNRIDGATAVKRARAAVLAIDEAMK